MAIKMFIMFIIGDTTSAFGSLCNLGLVEQKHRNHRCDMLLIVMLFLEQVLFLQQKPYVGNYYQSVNFIDSKFWGRGLTGE